MADYYTILGVPRSASQAEIRKAYKKIARENHPDNRPGDKAAEERFKKAAEAYDVLGDEDKRKQYDQFGEAYKYAGKGQNPFQGGFRGGGGQEIDLEDLFGGGVDLGDLFGGAFGGAGGRAGAGRQRPPRTQKGDDHRTRIQVPFQTAANGGTHDLSLQRNGRTERLSVKIPAGVRDGSVIRLAGEGSPGINGGPNGDLLVTINVAPHPWFRRDGDHVLLEVPVSLTEAALGAKVDVPTLSEGQVSLTIPPGTSSGTKLRLRGKGFPNSKTKERGDQLVSIKVVVPRELDDRSRELLQELARELPQNPRDGLWSA
ncbi:Curved DNA-binding protein [Maioricimonas rarisocia]|uniref:Curved DNA-binding protein n=1 Tax=Maioricimonas rarisocia TaxID=2528026 RepID=A0A517ZDA9_9PLAN|nr:DnaJ C-terminal domain-containing protein [Maioricimonas rarisocia]QDU40430.1 Curved DNA-binding protein [Maioricimonas rarisocia]